MEIVRVRPKHFPAPVAPFSYGIKVRGGHVLFLPNQFPIDSEGQVVGKGDIVSQAITIFENVGAVLTAVNAKFEDIVKMTWYLTNSENWKPVVDVRGRYFKDKWPAATFILLDHLSRNDILIELNAIAALK